MQQGSALISYNPTIAVGAKSQEWENEGGSIKPDDDAARLGVVRHLTETYSVGAFRYTSLTDAVAQARRLVTLEHELLA